jgi:hypothetical protein
MASIQPASRIGADVVSLDDSVRRGDVDILSVGFSFDPFRHLPHALLAAREEATKLSRFQAVV